METQSLSKAVKHARAHALSDEQSLCLKALESGAYDDMSDQEWVALCERLAADARHHEDLVAAELAAGSDGETAMGPEIHRARKK